MTVSVPTAIETLWRGVRFRSRLEARWAVFFDELGVEYSYEPEGFDIDGIWYLPDFWLPQQSVFLEAKPSLDRVPLDELRKISAFGLSDMPWGATGLLLLDGPPHPEKEGMGPWFIRNHHLYSNILRPEAREAWFHLCPDCHRLSVEYGALIPAFIDAYGSAGGKWSPPELGYGCHHCGACFGVYRRTDADGTRVVTYIPGDFERVRAAAARAHGERFIR